MPRLCAFGCRPTDVSMHHFPSFRKHREQFQTWVTLVGGRLDKPSDYEYYRKKRVCDIHFTDGDRNRNNRLNAMAVPSLHLPGKLDHNYSNNEVHKDHTYIKDDKKGTTGIQSVASTSKIVLPTTSSSGTDINETSTLAGLGELSNFSNTNNNTSHSSEHLPGTLYDEPTTADTDDIELNEFTPTSPDPPPDFSAPRDENVFSWQKSELIPADEDEPEPEPEVVPTLDLEGPTDPSSVSLYDDPELEAVTNATIPSGRTEIEYVCKGCGEGIDGFQFWCIQCVGCVLCGACGVSAHRTHYMLRAPAGKLHSEMQAVLGTIRCKLQDENLITVVEAEDDGVKVEVKEEPPEPAAPPATPDPLGGAGDTHTDAHLSPQQPQSAASTPSHTQTQYVADESVEYYPFKRPRIISNIHRVQNSSIARPVATKLTPIAPKVTQVVTKVPPVLTKVAIPVARKVTPIATQLTPFKVTTAPTNVISATTKGIPVATKVTSDCIELDDSEDDVEYMEIEALDEEMEEERIEEEHIERLEGEEERIEEEHIERLEGEEEIVEEEHIERLEGEEERIEEEHIERLEGEEEEHIERLEEDIIGDVERLESDERIYDSDSEMSEYIPEKRKGRKGRIVRTDDEDDSTDESDIENVTTRSPSKRIESIAARGVSKGETISNVKENVTKRTMDWRKDIQTEETLKMRGPEEVMSKILPTKALVRVRPLSSLEVKKWTGTSKKD